MPYRKIPFIAGEYYHVFNRSIAKQTIFTNQRDYQRATETIEYYRFSKLPLRFSHFNRLTNEQKDTYRETHMADLEPVITIHGHCLMPNHFHFLLQPSNDKAISDFLRNFQNSYSKYFNIKNNRTGSVFQDMFKAVRIESEEQLVHVSRYIHINPTTSYIVKPENISNYPWSSLSAYLDEGDDSFVETKTILSFFPSRSAYKKFLLDQVDYQRQLDNIKHLLLED